MQFILNVALDPHFCAIFDESGKLVASHTWEIRQRDGEEVWEWVEKKIPQELSDKITFVGGITGPGGFTSLRVGAGIINAMASAHQISVHQVRADKYVEALMGESKGGTIFLLNSFSDGVYYPQNGELIREDIESAGKRFQGQSLGLDFLPEAKQEKLIETFQIKNKALRLSLEEKMTVLFQTLKAQPEQKLFLPDYEFPPVQ